jgi:hypothetical protein
LWLTGTSTVPVSIYTVIFLDGTTVLGAATLGGSLQADANHTPNRWFPLTGSQNFAAMDKTTVYFANDVINLPSEY